LQRLAIAFFVALLFTAAPAHADPADEAVALYERGSAAYRKGEFREAVTLLERAYALRPDPVLLYNIGRAQEGLGDYPRAIAAYERYLKEESEVPDRAALERRISILRRQIAEQEQYKQRQQAQRTSMVLPWIVVGVGGAALGVGTVFGIMAQSKEHAASDDPVQQSAASQGKTASSLATIANVGFIAGSAITLGGVTWVLIRSTDRQTSTALRLAPHLGGISLHLEL
jgi:tetratricopeptide (TPR) repeat protein